MCVEFSPFSNAYKLFHEYDVMMVCPHTRYEILSFIKKHDDLDTFIYVLPPKMYGQMNAEELYIDAEDIIRGYNESKINPWHFPGKEDAMMVKTVCSYRNYRR